MPARPKPTSDWTCREVLDAKAVEPSGIAYCEFCKTRIRWIHVLEHDRYSRTVETGCCCAKRLCFDYDAEGAERELKNRANRLMRFMDPRRWKRSKANSVNVWRFIRLADGQRIRVTVFLRDGTYGIYFVDKSNPDDRYCYPERYESRREAMTVAFEVVDRS